MLFRPAPRFAGLPADAFRVFGILERDERRRAIVERFHPALRDLGEDLLARLNPEASAPLHAHLPRLDWPHGYQPFCTWLALSRESHGYQAGPQLNVAVHADYVAARLAWDAQAAAFGRFEFLCRHGGLGNEILELARTLDLRFRVYASAPWPEGSRLVFESEDDLGGSFDEIRRRGVWWELGIRWDLPGALELVASSRLGEEVGGLFARLLPVYERLY